MNKVNEFWVLYRDAVTDSGVPEKTAAWYVHWAKKFAKSIKGKRLRSRSSEDVNSFLNEMESQRGIEPWQVSQARDALVFLYKNFLKLDLKPEKPADRLKGKDEAGKTDEKKEDSGFLDNVVSKDKLSAKHAHLFQKLETVMRTRHYSIRTEQTYSTWVARFLSFHGLKNPDQLKADAIEDFLSYLAQVRNVSASTQNQALNAIVFLYKEVLQNEPGDFADFIRAKRPQRLPEVLLMGRPRVA